MDSALWSAPLLISAEVRNRVEHGDVDFTASLYASEISRARALYDGSGDPRAAYLYTAGYSSIGSTFPGGLVEIAAHEAMLAELLIAQGSGEQVLNLATTHLSNAERHARTAEAPAGVRGRIISKVTLLRAIALKAMGQPDDAFHALGDYRSSSWWQESVAYADSISLVRQEVMMRGDEESYMRLLRSARSYEKIRPLEYFRTLKRVFEFATNNGLYESTVRLRPKLLSAYGAVAKATTPISKISLLKNLSQADALEGNLVQAMRRLQVSKSKASQLGLAGQLRQIGELEAAYHSGLVVGSLRTFTVGSQ